jgi:hypothetical protein
MALFTGGVIHRASTLLGWDDEISPNGCRGAMYNLALCVAPMRYNGVTI